METPHQGTALFHLPGLFEFYDLYAAFLPLYRAHREYFYDWCAIGSIYGAPSDCLWAVSYTHLDVYKRQAWLRPMPWSFISRSMRSS